VLVKAGGRLCRKKTGQENNKEGKRKVDKNITMVGIGIVRE